jgi:hypothetical protein
MRPRLSQALARGHEQASLRPSPQRLTLSQMGKLGGILGAILGLTIQLIFTEWLYIDTFADQAFLEILIGAVLVVSGAFGGSLLARRFVNRNANPS